MNAVLAPRREPYMPDSARARMPNSDLQPLPAYLREDFAQSLDRSRPHELVVRTVNGKPVDGKRQHSLQYVYLDTGETVTVPNAWYNQPVPWRVSWWEFEEERTRRNLERAQAELAAVEACTAPYYKDRLTSKALSEARWRLEDCRRVHETVVQVLADVRAGTRLL